MEKDRCFVLLHRVPPEGLDLDCELADPAAEGIELSVPVQGPLRARFHVERFEGKMRVTGEVEAEVVLECARCLRPFRLPVRGEVDATFAPAAAAGDHQHELSTDELEVEALERGGADLGRLAAEQVHLALPIKPLCSPTCRGICPHCGRDLGGEPCGCSPPAGDPRWEALRKLVGP